jgi:hypothetical protein
MEDEARIATHNNESGDRLSSNGAKESFEFGFTLDIN